MEFRYPHQLKDNAYSGRELIEEANECQIEERFLSIMKTLDMNLFNVHKQ